MAQPTFDAGIFQAALLQVAEATQAAAAAAKAASVVTTSSSGSNPMVQPLLAKLLWIGRNWFQNLPFLTMQINKRISDITETGCGN